MPDPAIDPNSIGAGGLGAGAIALLNWFMNKGVAQKADVSDLRAEMAKDYVRKDDLERELENLGKRLDRLDTKIDQVLMSLRGKENG